jgi:hypothetical protein
MNKNTLRAVLVAGLIGSASLGLAGAANAAVIPHQDSALAAHSHQFAGHKQSEDGDSSEGPAQDVTALDDQSEPAANDSAPEAPEAPEAPVTEPEAPADTPADAPADSAPESPADAPADSAPEAPADAPADHTPADAPDNVPSADAPSQDDINAAEAAEPVSADPEPAQASEVQEMTELVEETMTSESTTTTDEWNHEVTTWDSSWVSYDANNNPVILNPYNYSMSLYYTYDNAPRVVTVPPLQRVALDAPAPGVYPFTSVVKDPSGPIRQVSVGSFTGGGPKATPLTTLKNVLVKLNYPNGSSQPFRVKTLADLGDDSAIGARRVLIDGAVSAWGQWSKSPNGEQQFVITKTLQLPGLAAPSAAPLPGYNVALR